MMTAKIRIGDSDRVFSLQERGGAEPPELVVHDLDVKRWLEPVLLGLATKITPDGDVPPLNPADR
jgi:hypothetical protein